MGRYDEILEGLPEPRTAEEQYLRSLVYAAAGEGAPVPFQSPYWRKERYLFAWWQVTAARLTELNTPSDGTVTTPKLVDGAVTAEKLADGAVTAEKVSESVLAELAERAAAEALAEGSITEEMLSPALREKLLGEGRVSTAMIADKAVTKAKLADGVLTA